MTKTISTDSKLSKPDALPQFTMRFEPMTIEHLGLRLYSTLPPVIAELVSNAHECGVVLSRQEAWARAIELVAFGKMLVESLPLEER